MQGLGAGQVQTTGRGPLSDAWIPGISQLQPAKDGGPLRGGLPRVVWQSLEADPHTVSARSAAQRIIQLGQASHLVWNPVAGEIVQLIPIVRAACGLGSSQPGASTEGRLCVQIAVVASARSPFTAGPLAGLQPILDWLDSWRVLRHWPAGRPAAFPHGVAAPRSSKLWARGGHFGASQVPGSAAVGPGALDTDRLTGSATGSATGEQDGPSRRGRPLNDLDHIFAARSELRAPLSRAR